MPTRRAFLAASAAALASPLLPRAHAPALAQTRHALPDPSPEKLPRWRGFNLLEKFTLDSNAPYLESDLDLIAELGFNFIRLPMDYRCWIAGNDWNSIDEDQLKPIDRVIEQASARSIHVSLNFHRAPGYCVNPPAEPRDLWTDPIAQQVAAKHWAHFAGRYRDIPSARLSFDLVNEPARTDIGNYVAVARILIEAIRGEHADRLIIADGHNYGREPVHDLAALRVAQSTRGYDPFTLSHYRAGWAEGSDRWPVPTWPHTENNSRWDKDRLRCERIQPWLDLASKGVGVHVGEWGPYNRTPHGVALAWMADLLDLWKQAGWGWALWNFRGSFGIFDSGRPDVAYESFRGRQLDRAMLNLLQSDA